MKIIRKTYTILVVAVVALFFSTCEKDEDVPISTAKVDITEQTASYRNVQQKGFFVSNATITSAELHYANDSTFSNYQTLALSVGKDKSYTASIAPLQAGATYYVRYKVANSYSSMLLPCIDMLRTLAYTLPEVATDSVGSITVSSFVGYGTLVDWGCDSLSEFGFCYGDSANPTIEGQHTTCAEKDSHFSAEIADLDDGETYYMRAYAVNAIGIAYGADIKFSTLSKTKPTVVTNEVTDITVSSAVCGGKITSNGYSEITECGICYSKSTEPTIDDKKVVCKQDDNGEFSAELTGLNEGTAYHVRAYAMNAKGVAYGEDYRFSTKSTTIPTVTTNVVTDITTSSTVCGGKIMSDGYSEITECGICYSTSADPTIDDKKVVCEQNDNGEFSAELTGLNENTTYHVRAYAINAKGVAYGEGRNFTTVTITLPTVVTLEISDILRESAVCSGKITNDGNSEILACGICYSTSADPTIEDKKVVCEQNDNGEFSAELTGLSENTTYHVRAYATNAKGTAYGEERNFTTNASAGIEKIALKYPETDKEITLKECNGLNGGNSESSLIYVTIEPSDLSVSESDFVCKSSDESVAMVDFNIGEITQSICATIHAIAHGTATITIASAKDESIKVESKVTVASCDTIENGHAWVDLGLPSGLKWATCNIGASKPEEYGDYYAWGETTTKSVYSWDNYKHSTASEDLTKYCTKETYGKNGFTDDLTDLEPKDDAAMVIWGGSWRMPTDEEWIELENNCTWTSIIVNGVSVYKVMSKKNANFIIIPLAGSKDYYLRNEGSDGVYWSSVISLNYPNNAYELVLTETDQYCGSSPRYLGQPIRAVCE